MSGNKSDLPLKVNGRLDGQANSFSGSVRVTVTDEGQVSQSSASGATSVEVRLLPADLHKDGDPTATIDRSNVTIPADTNVTIGQPHDVRVTINNIAEPGDYNGTLQLFLPDHLEAAALPIPVQLHVDVRPIVQPVHTSASYQLVRCHFWLDCALATVLLPASMLQEHWLLQIDNPTPLPVTINDATVVMSSSKTGNVLSSDAMSLGVPHTLRASQTEAIDVMIAPSRLAPDEYDGQVVFKVKGSNDLTMLKTNLKVRDGPFWPLVVIVLGIFFGRLARNMASPTVQKQLQLWPHLIVLQDKANDLLAPQDERYITDELGRLNDRISAGQEDEAVLKKALDDLGWGLETLSILEQAERTLGSDPLMQQLSPLIEQTRTAVFSNNLDQARQLRTTIETQLEKALPQGDPDGSASPSLPWMGLLNRLQVTNARASTGTRPAQNIPTGSRSPQWLTHLLAGLAGVRVLTPGVRYMVVRPLLALVLLALLVLLGMQTLYLGAGATLGAGGLYDYLSFFLWGFSADIAQTTLLSLPGMK